MKLFLKFTGTFGVWLWVIATYINASIEYRTIVAISVILIEIWYLKEVIENLTLIKIERQDK